MLRLTSLLHAKTSLYLFMCEHLESAVFAVSVTRSIRNLWTASVLDRIYRRNIS